MLNNNSYRYNKNYSNNSNNKNNNSRINNNNNKYESFNIVSETGDSIFDASTIEESIIKMNGDGGQIFVAEDKIREIVKEELDKRLGILSNTNGSGN